MTKTGTALDRARNARAELRASIESLRDDIASAKLDMKEAIAAPRDRASVYASIDAWVTRIVAQEGGAKITAKMFIGNGDGRPALPGGDGSAFLRILAPVVADVLKRDVDEALAGISPMTEEERQHAISLIDRRLLDLELSEEALIREAESSGFPIQRRGDADPRAVLAHDKALP